MLKGKGSRIAFVVSIDVLLVCLGLYVYCLFQFILPRDINYIPINLPRPSVSEINADDKVAGDPTEQKGDTVENSPESTADSGDWGSKFPDKFTSGEVIKTKNSYKSKDINVTLTRVQNKGITYFVADIYIRNLENFRTAFANNKFGIGQRDSTVDMAKENNAIIAMSGDYYGARQEGIVIRNGKLYRDSIFQDILVMYFDGSMKTFTAEEFNINDILNNGAYQGWSFGPELLDNGNPMTKFNSVVTPANPRNSIGYYEPGHYCFITVDGRQDGYSKGISLKGLSQLYYDLGCKVAYNLDGGQTAVLAFLGETANQPFQGGRDVSDILYIGEQ